MKVRNGVEMRMRMRMRRIMGFFLALVMFMGFLPLNPIVSYANNGVEYFDPLNVVSVSVKTQPAKLTYTEGDKLDLSGLVVRLIDDKGVTKDVPFAELGTYKIRMQFIKTPTVPLTTYPENGTPLTVTENNGGGVALAYADIMVTQTAELVVKKFDQTHVVSMSVKTQPAKLTYTDGDKLDLSGLEVTLTDNQGLKKDVPFAEFTDYDISANPKNETKLTVADHNGKTVKLTKGSLSAETSALMVKAKEFDPTHVVSMSVKTQPAKLTYTDGDKLDLSGLEVTLTDNQGLKKDVPFAEFTDYDISANPKNETKLTVADHNGKTVKLTKAAVQAVETDKLKVNSVPAPTPTPTPTPAPAPAPTPKPQPKKRIGMIPKTGESASFAGLLAALGFSIAGLAILLKKKMTEENNK